MSEEKVFFPEFPENGMGLERGTILEANQDVPEMDLSMGDKITLGYDGQYVRCAQFTWSIEQIENEVRMGIWTISDKVVDLSEEEEAVYFAEKIELRTISPLH